MPHSFDAVVFVESPPTIRIDGDGLVHVCQEVGREILFERVMRLTTLMRSIHQAKKAIADYEARGCAEIIEFPRPPNHG